MMKRANTSSYDWQFLKYLQNSFGGKFEFVPFLKIVSYVYEHKPWGKLYEVYCVTTDIAKKKQPS